MSEAKDTFYITSAIYYANDLPHVGHTYEIVACDVIARYHRQRGERVWFLTGSDEHSQNVIAKAAENGVSPQEWTDRIVPEWQAVWRRLGISNDDWIRTSERRHVERVQRFVQVLYDRGEIYMGTYEGPYCPSCEEFKTEADVVDGRCRIHGIPVQQLSEDNYFFRLSKYQDALLELYDRNPGFVEPDFRRNEVVAFVRSGLKDLSVSRHTQMWGVPIPWDPEHVTYVWVDALLNYITAIGFGVDDAGFDRRWPADVHMVGKDIIRFHAVIWPAMLMAAGIELPRQVFAHGWLLTPAGERMSKSRGTGVHPDAVLDAFGVDAFRWFLFREATWGQDGTFSSDALAARYTAELANGLGNLASRVLAMVGSYFEGRVPEPSTRHAGGVLSAAAGDAVKRFDAHMDAVELSDAAADVDGLIREGNRRLVDVAPWALAKDPERRGDLADSLYEALEALRVIALLAWPIMPDAAARLWTQLGLEGSPTGQAMPDAASWGGLEPGAATRRGEGLFPRLEA